MASEIRVNKIENRSGLGTVTFADTGVDLAGIVTATTFSGSGASLTSLPAANITGTLPAISAANLTNIPAANVTGTLPAISAANLTNIPAANVTGTLPALTAANLTNIPAANIVGVCTSGLTKTGGFGGITMATQWRVTADFTIGTGDGNYTIASNWETADTLGFARIGSDLTESSGVFTFPSTGIYRIFAHTVCNNTSSASYRAQLAIHVTTDNSSYDTAAVGKHSFSSPAEQSGGMNCEYLFDVTSTSTHKFKIIVRTYQDNIKFQGDTDKPQTSINVFRLGDT